MVLYCAVNGCETVANNGFHSFPSNKSEAEKWILVTKAFHLMDRLNANKLNRSYYKVCRKHFKDSDLQLNGKGQPVVKPGRTPTLFLPKEIILQPTIPSTTQKSLDLSQLQHGHDSKSDNPLKSLDAVVLEGDIIENECATSDRDSDVDVEGLSSEDNIESTPKTVHKRNNCRRSPKVTNGSLHTLNYYKRRVKELRNKVKCSKINDARVLNYLSKKFNEQLLEFVAMQLQNCGRSKHGRRYTPEQKSLCLAMYKQGPKAYRFNEKWCALPTSRTLGRYSAKLMFKSGVDPKIFEAIKSIVKDWTHKNKLCSFMWDEVSLDQHLDYCHSQDKIEGFVEINEEKKPMFATHSMTFMVRGFDTPFKQAVGYFYTNGISSFELVELIKLMLEAVFTSGLIPILSMCDTTNTNATAINILMNASNESAKQTGDLLVYTVNGHRLVHGFDPSHLIKVVRNNFQVKNVAHFLSERWHTGYKGDNGSLQIACWEDVDYLYRVDLSSAQRDLEKLTEEHLNPTKLKMRVANATQVFSDTCGSVMLKFVKQGKVPEHFTSTAKLLFFMNDLFDSINGSDTEPAGTLKSSLTPNSMLFEFWEYTLFMLQNTFFVDKTTGERNDRSSVFKKTESTIRAYKEIARICFAAGVTKINIRDTTQDGLENFFGCVKTCNQNKGTASTFRTGYATMTINNITGTNSLRSNCQPDQSTAMLTNIHDFITACREQPIHLSTEEQFINSSTEKQNTNPSTEKQSIEITNAFNNHISVSADEDNFFDDQPDTLHFDDLESMVVFDNRPEKTFSDNEYSETNVHLVQQEDISCASSKICQKIFKMTKCDECKENFDLMDESSALSSIERVVGQLNYLIPQICYQDSLKKKLLTFVKPMETKIIGCESHNDEIDRKIKTFAADHVILTFCNDINKLLSGKTRILPENPNFIQKLAFDQRNKKKNIGKYTDIFNQN